MGFEPPSEVRSSRPDSNLFYNTCLQCSGEFCKTATTADLKNESVLNLRLSRMQLRGKLSNFPRSSLKVAALAVVAVAALAVTAVK